MITRNTYNHGFSEGFTDPFRYAPHPLVRKAAEIVMERVKGMDENTRTGFEEGKMLGVLVVGVPAGISDFTDWLEKNRIHCRIFGISVWIKSYRRVRSTSFRPYGSERIL